jgi:hypothetical protein
LVVAFLLRGFERVEHRLGMVDEIIVNRLVDGGFLLRGERLVGPGARRRDRYKNRQRASERAATESIVLHAAAARHYWL